MKKERSYLDKLWYNTHPVDSWILEHISFFKNCWGQKVMVGSRLMAIHDDAEKPDTIRYDRNPGNTSDIIDISDAIFVINYYSEYCHVYYPKERTNKQTLEYAEPTFLIVSKHLFGTLGP